jgi:hypothetical protein
VQAAGTYDDELLDRHFITGDGRGNENIALTTVHHVFHSEHNRQVDAIKATVLATNDPDFIASWQLPTARGTASACSRPPASPPRCSTSTWCSRSSRASWRPASTVPGARRLRRHHRSGHRRRVRARGVPRRPHDADGLRRPAGFRTSTPTDLSLLEAFLNPVAFNNDGALTPEEAPAPSCAA